MVYTQFMAMASPRQKDIADKLDLSVATVSRSLLGYSNIHPATRRKVIELASEMGYRASSKLRRRNHASSQNRKKHLSIGMVVCWSQDAERDPAQAAYRELISIGAAAEKNNVSVVTHFAPPEQCHRIIDPGYQFPAFRAGILSGLILVYGFPRSVVHNLTRRMPCVSIGHSYLNLGADWRRRRPERRRRHAGGLLVPVGAQADWIPVDVRGQVVVVRPFCRLPMGDEAAEPG